MRTRRYIDRHGYTTIETLTVVSLTRTVVSPSGDAFHYLSSPEDAAALRMRLNTNPHKDTWDQA